jgi:hypothetical protein
MVGAGSDFFVLSFGKVVVGVVALLGEQAADGEAVDEEREADDGGVGDGWAVEFVGLFLIS